MLTETCNTNAHQASYFQYSGIYMKVRSQDADARGKCLTYCQGNQIYMTPCFSESGPNVYYQRWWIDEIGTTGWYQLENDEHGTNQCLDVRAARATWCRPGSAAPTTRATRKWKFW